MKVEDVKKVRIGEVADTFGISTQTIRNWLKHDELKGLLSPGATPRSGQQAEFTPEDVQVINSIWSLTTSGNHDWRSIAENLKSGWREGYLPARAAIVGIETNSAVGLAVQLASTTEQLNAERKISQMLKERVEEYKQQLEKSDTEREEYMKKLIKAEVALELWESGRLKPLEGQGDVK